MPTHATKVYVRSLNKEEERCWRGTKITLCDGEVVAAGLCREHLEEMKEW